MNLLITLHQKGGLLTFTELDQSPAKDKGMGFVTEDRVEQLIATECIKYQDDHYFVTDKGKLILKLFDLFLKVFGLNRFL